VAYAWQDQVAGPGDIAAPMNGVWESKRLLRYWQMEKAKGTALTAADPLCRDLMSNGMPWQRLSVGPSAAWAGLACCSRLAGEGSLCCRWLIALRLHNARNALVSRRRCGE